MLITADWVLPVSSAPLRFGGVLTDGDGIVAVGAAAELAASPLASERRDFPGCLITPGLVNAHTHLTLTALGGVIPAQAFERWLPRLVAALKPWDVSDHEASGVVGAEECLLSGVTVVGDIAYGAAEVASAAKAGLGGVFYWELLGLHAEQVDEHLAYLRYPIEAGAYGDRVVCGLSPHSPYTSGPGLLRAVHAKAHDLGVPLALHAAESAAEVELLRSGTGPLAGTAGRTAHGFEPPGHGAVAYLASLDVLEDATLVHLGHCESGDIALLAPHVRGVVACPRSNRYLGNPTLPAAQMSEAGIAVGVGTDSSASNADLDLMAEVRCLAELQPGLSAERLLAMATLDGARAIGAENRFGSLDPGKAADLAVFAVTTAREPVAAAVTQAGASNVVAVMSGGAWRVSDGRLLVRDDVASRRAADARRRSLEAVSDL